MSHVVVRSRFLVQNFKSREINVLCYGLKCLTSWHRYFVNVSFQGNWQSRRRNVTCCGNNVPHCGTVRVFSPKFQEIAEINVLCYGLKCPTSWHRYFVNVSFQGNWRSRPHFSRDAVSMTVQSSALYGQCNYSI